MVAANGRGPKRASDATRSYQYQGVQNFFFICFSRSNVHYKRGPGNPQWKCLQNLYGHGNKICAKSDTERIDEGVPEIDALGFELDSGRKTAQGEAIYSKKAAVIPKLYELLAYACYSNWGARKDKDPKTVIGYYNFKAYIYIDNKKECVRLAVRAMSNGAFYYSVEVNKRP